MDRDGTKDGYDLDLTRAVAEAVNVPVIASGGAGTLDHLVEVIEEGEADAVLAASIFHYGEYTIRQAKEHMAARDPGAAVTRVTAIKATLTSAAAYAFAGEFHIFLIECIPV